MASLDVGVSRLERTAKLAGESFGHEDLAQPATLASARLPSRLLWAAVALVAVAGFLLLNLR